MPRLLQFVLVLILGLAGLAWLVTEFVQETAREWFERDVSLRARLVVTGARPALVAHWAKAQRRDLRTQLTEIARDDRVMAVAACDADLTTLAVTPNYPDEFGCREIGPQVLSPEASAGRPLREWDSVSRLPGGSVHISAVPVWDAGRQLGFVVLIHDLSYAERREAATRNFLMIAFGVLGLMASGITIFVARLTRRSWSAELRSMLHGDKRQRPEFQPILRDVRELIQRVTDEKEDGPGVWTAEKLKKTLSQYLL